MGANVLRGQVSQDLGRLFVMRVSVLCCPIAQNSHSPFSPNPGNVALKNLPAEQHTTCPELPSNVDLGTIVTIPHAVVVVHHARVKFVAPLNISCVLKICFIHHLEASALKAPALINPTHHPKRRKQWTRKGGGKK